MPITLPAYVPPEADTDQQAFEAWVEESVDSALLAKTTPDVAAAQAALVARATLAPNALIDSARLYYDACRTFAQALITATLREHPTARWLRSANEREVARRTFRTGVRAQGVMLPRGAIPKVFQEVLGDKVLAHDADCSTCGGPRSLDIEAACPWCGALRVSEPDNPDPMIRAQIDALIDRGQDDLQLASTALQFLIAPVWQGHSLGPGGDALSRVGHLLPWLEREVLLQAIGLMRHMGNPEVSRWLDELQAALSSWKSVGERPAPAPRKAPSSMSLEDAWDDPWVRKAAAEFRMMGTQAQPVMVAVGTTRTPAMLGGTIAPEQAAAYLMRVLQADALAEIPAAFDVYRPAFPEESSFYDAVCRLIDPAFAASRRN